MLIGNKTNMIIFFYFHSHIEYTRGRTTVIREITLQSIYKKCPVPMNEGYGRHVELGGIK